MSHKKVLLTSVVSRREEPATIPRVMVESPLGGDLQNNLVYARLAMRHSLFHMGESPMAFHLIYTQSLCDDTDVERQIGIFRSFDWHTHASKKLFYIDRGFSNGMKLGYLDAVKKGIEVEFRSVSPVRSDAINSVLDMANAKVQTSEELDKLSDLLKRLAESNKRLGVGIDGDAFDYRSHSMIMREISIVEQIAQEDSLEYINYERLAMRQSLLNYDEAPLSLDLLYSQFMNMNEGVNILDVGQSWVDVADEVIVYNNPCLSSRGKVDREIDVTNLDEDMDFIEKLNHESYSSRERDMNHDII